MQVTDHRTYLALQTRLVSPAASEQWRRGLPEAPPGTASHLEAARTRVEASGCGGGRALGRRP